MNFKKWKFKQKDKWGTILLYLCSMLAGYTLPYFFYGTDDLVRTFGKHTLYAYYVSASLLFFASVYAFFRWRYFAKSCG